MGSGRGVPEGGFRRPFGGSKQAYRQKSGVPGVPATFLANPNYIPHQNAKTCVWRLFGGRLEGFWRGFQSTLCLGRVPEGVREAVWGFRRPFGGFRRPFGGPNGPPKRGRKRGQILTKFWVQNGVKIWVKKSDQNGVKKVTKTGSKFGPKRGQNLGPKKCPEMGSKKWSKRGQNLVQTGSNFDTRNGCPEMGSRNDIREGCFGRRG